MREYLRSDRRAVGNDINRSYKWFPWWLISTGTEDLRDEEQCTMEVLIVAVDEVESQSAATYPFVARLPTYVADSAGERLPELPCPC